jgi:enoyl-CoA hydratase
VEYQQIIYQPGRVARIILNRPKYLNAQSRRMREEMDDCFAKAMADDNVGVVVLSGAGEHFSAGHDIGTKEDREDQLARGVYTGNRYDRYRHMRYVCLEMCLRWRGLPKPTIAMVHGYCIYGGYMFATSMDVLFASEDALFLPGHTQYFTAPWDIGWKKAKEVVLEHRFLTAWECYEYGFVNRVYPREKLEQETLAYAERVADNWFRNPFMVRTDKFSINHAMDTMGFTAATEAAYQSFCVLQGLTANTVTPPSEGGYAQTNLAKKNLELAKAWLEFARQRKLV